MNKPIGRTVVVGAVRFYQVVVSPWLPPACRFTPTCSQYAVEAIEHYGVCRGALRSLSRLLRCHPLHRGGFDPST
jgi:putative membrane protein insertion efficiency factor